MTLRTLSALTLLLGGLGSPALADDQQPALKILHSSITEDACEVVSGDYGAPEAMMHVISHCNGPGDWTVVLHEYASFQRIALRHGDEAAPDPLPMKIFGRYGAIGEQIEWIEIDGDLKGATVWFEEDIPSDRFERAANLYAIALKPEDTPSACLISRTEFGQKRGVSHAARLSIELMADDWTCGDDEMLEFTPETTQGKPYADAVRSAASLHGEP